MQRSNNEASLEFLPLWKLRDMLQLKDQSDSSSPAGLPIFIGIDIEAYELAQDKITEIGISSLDTREWSRLRDPTDLSPLRRSIQTRHFIVEEHKELVNEYYLTGNPKGFKFGKSEDIALNEVPRLLENQFRKADTLPSSAHAERREDRDMFSDDSLLTGSIKPAREPERRLRRIILVGHAIRNDLRFLKFMEYTPPFGEEIVGIVDTQRLAADEGLPQSLSKLLATVHIGVQDDSLHNAGNDAHHTMEAMLQLIAGMYAKVENEPTSQEKEKEKDVKHLQHLETGKMKWQALTRTERLAWQKLLRISQADAALQHSYMTAHKLDAIQRSTNAEVGKQQFNHLFALAQLGVLITKKGAVAQAPGTSPATSLGARALSLFHFFDDVHWPQELGSVFKNALTKNQEKMFGLNGEPLQRSKSDLYGQRRKAVQKLNVFIELLPLPLESHTEDTAAKADQKSDVLETGGSAVTAQGSRY